MAMTHEVHASGGVAARNPALERLSEELAKYLVAKGTDVVNRGVKKLGSVVEQVNSASEEAGVLGKRGAAGRGVKRSGPQSRSEPRRSCSPCSEPKSAVHKRPSMFLN